MSASSHGIGLEQLILDLEAQRCQAMIKKDMPTLESLLAPELSYVHSGGRNDDRQAFIDLIASPTSNYISIDYSGTEVITWGDSSALVRGVAKLHLGARANGPETTYSVLFIDVWAQRDSRWQMIAWNATRVPD